MLRKLFPVLLLAFLGTAHAALSRTSLLSSTTFGSATASFTPANSSLLVVVVGGVENSNGGMRGTDFTISDSASLTWTSRGASTGATGWSYGGRIWSAPVTTGVSMTITVGAGAHTLNNIRIDVLQYTGQNATPTGATASGSVGAGADGAQSVTLSGSPASSSEVLALMTGAVNSGTVNITEGAGFTEIVDAPLIDQRRQEIQIRTGSTSTSVPWVDAAVGGDPSGVGVEMLAVEIVAAGGGGGFVCQPVMPSNTPKCGTLAPSVLTGANERTDNVFRVRAIR